MSIETQENRTYSMQSSPFNFTQNINGKCNRSVHTESQSTNVSKNRNEEKSDESKFLNDDQGDVECPPVIRKERKGSGQILRKRIHSRRKGKNKQKKIKTSQDEKSDLPCLSYETTKKISWEEIQNVLHRKISTELDHNILGKKLEELTRRIDNIDCTQKHEELAKSIQIRIKHLERKVKIALQTINRASLRKKSEESKMIPGSNYPPPGAKVKCAESMANANYMDSHIALVDPSDQASQLLPCKKTPDTAIYELNLQKLTRFANSLPKDAKNERNIALPKNLDTVTPASIYSSGVTSIITQRNVVSPDILIWSPDSEGQQGDARQEYNLTSSRMIIDLTKDDEWYLNNQTRFLLICAA
ncbi:activating transcription factor 7-interacting protein 2-like isoform X2 [Narcine bancroftii]|uniref:activating transcription factor 7-interacting protein 2-like isoform X2 n=1 Tax=Narcine bancroftii TaxID=1343680 RepID=UPI003831A44C